MLKKLFGILLILLSFSVLPVAAEEMITVTQHPITVTYNGSPVIFTDAVPVVQNGRTLVPMRPIMERAGLTVDFDPAALTITAEKASLTVIMQIDSQSAEIFRDGSMETASLDEPARIIDGRTFVPVRFIADSLGIKVNWNPYAREVVLIDTDEWKQNLAETSSYLLKQLETPFADAPVSGNASGNVRLIYSAKNLPGSSDTRRSSDADLELSYSGTGVFDGVNAGFYASANADLTQLQSIDRPLLKKLFGRELTDDTFAALSDKHTIEAELIADTEHMLYGKSSSMKKLLKKSGQEAIASEIGDNYVSMQPAEFYSLLPDIMNLSALANLPSNGSSLWEEIENTVNADDKLYTGSVELMDKLLKLYAELYADKWFTVTKLWDGSLLYKFKPEEKSFKETALEIYRLTGEANGTPVEEAAWERYQSLAEKAKLKLTVTMTVYEDTLVKSEILFKIDVPEHDIPGTEKGVRQFSLEINTGKSYRSFESKWDRKITLPKKTVAFSDLKINK